MGGTYSKHYKIIANLENNPNVVVIQSFKICTRFFTKQSLTNPYKVKVVWRKKDDVVERIAVSSTIEQIVSNFTTLLSDCIEGIENILGKNTVETEEVYRMLERELLLHSYFESNGIYTINYSFNPFIKNSNDSYKMFYNLQTNKIHIPEIKNNTETEPETAPTADIYGKI